MAEWSAVVLAGGVGSRLRPLTISIPKPLVPVANKPMIDYNLELLRNAGITGKIVIITKYLKDEIKGYFDKINHFDDLEIIIPDVNPLDTADAVRKAANYIDTNHFIVSMADIITNLPLSDFMAFHQEKGGIASITLKDVPHPRAFGVIMLNQESRILLFLEKPIPQELGLATLTFSRKETIRLQSNLVNTGIYAFDHGVLDILENMDDLMDFGKHVFPYLAREYGIFGYARRDYYWMDAGNPETYLYTNWDVLRRWAYPYLPQATQEEGNIWCMEPKFNLAEGAKLISPIALGSNVSIGSGSLIDTLCVLGNNVVIGKNCTLKASVIWDNVQIGDNVKIENSIVCNNISIPSKSRIAPGTVIAPNYKLTEPIKTRKGQIMQ